MKKDSERGYWYIYASTMLSGYWDVFRYVYCIRRPDENGHKRFGLIAQLILEVGKLLGAVLTIATLLVFIAVTGVFWPGVLWFFNLFFSAYIYLRLKKQEKQNSDNSEQLSNELTDR